MAKDKGEKNPNFYKPNVWYVINNIVVASMNKGVFLPLLVFTILMVLILKMPINETTKLVNHIVDEIINFHLLGWGLSLLFLISWILNVKNIRRNQSEEMKRVSNEKTVLQEKLIGKKLSSSIHNI